MNTELSSIQAEQAVLGVAFNPLRVDEVLAAAKESYFSHHDNLTVFRAMKSLYASGKPVDLFTMLEELKGTDIGTYLLELTNISYLTGLEHYIKTLKDYDLKRRLHFVGAELMESIKTDPAQVVLESVCSKLMDASDSGAQKGPRHFKEIFWEHGPEIERRSDNEGKLNGLATGYRDIDQRLNGMMPGELIIIAARPSMGKTTFALDICRHVALHRSTVLIFSMEMSDRSLIEKMIASTGKIDSRMIKNGSVLNDPEACNKFSASVIRLKETNLFIDDRPALSPTDIRSASIKVERQHGKVGLIMVDYLQLMQVHGSKDNRTAEISEISRSLKALAKEMDCPVIALSQLNRGVESRSDKRPVNSDLRESGAIEQDADLIAFLYRDDYYNPESPNKGVTEIIWRKFREGEVGTDYLEFLGHCSRFEDKPPNWFPRKETFVSSNKKGAFTYGD